MQIWVSTWYTCRQGNMDCCWVHGFHNCRGVFLSMGSLSAAKGRTVIDKVSRSLSLYKETKSDEFREGHLQKCT